jgi:NitT/TauT family transport system permease protein
MRLSAILWPLVPLGLLLVAAELAGRAGWVAAYLMPTPTEVVAALGTHAADLARATGQTAAAALLGFGLSVIVGVSAATLLAGSTIARRALYPYAVFLQTVPIIAVAPLLVIWFGFGLRTCIASAFIVSVFPIMANTLTGMLSTDPALRDLFRLYRATGLATIFKLRLPFALPAILTGLRISGGLAVIGAIVGEFIAGGGLGGQIETARTQQRVDLVFAAILLASVLGLLLFACVNFLSWLLLRHWHASEQNR